jgi:hypothetical protein
MATDIENIGSTNPDFTDSYKVIGAGAINVVQHFGADPSGVVDATALIQAALDVSVHGFNGAGPTNGRGGVYFPPGNYKITGPIYLYGVATTVQSQGRIFAHPGTVLLVGTFAGYIFDNPNDGVNPPSASNSESCIIEGINFVNNSTNANSGCIRLRSNYNTNIRNCYFKGHHGVLLGSGTDEHVAFDSTVEHCRFVSIGTEGSWDTGSIGLGIGYNTRCYGCSFVTWDTAVCMWGGQAAIYSCRIEVCNVGIWHGIEPDLSTANTNSAGVIENIAFESCRYDIKLRSADGLSIRDILGQGNQDAPHDSQASFYYEANTGATNVVVTNYKTTGTWDLGGYYFANSPGTGHPEITFIGCQGDFDANGQNLLACEQYHCWFGQFSGTYAQLPTYVNHGSKRWISDSNKAVGTDAWGVVVAGGGANLAPVWYDGTNWRLGN